MKYKIGQYVIVNCDDTRSGEGFKEYWKNKICKIVKIDGFTITVDRLSFNRNHYAKFSCIYNNIKPYHNFKPNEQLLFDFMY